MSAFVRNLNQIKTQYDATWVSPSQEKALNALIKAIRYPGTVNLWGPIGSGKTFLCWILARQMALTYVPHISFLDELALPQQNAVIVDNCLADRSSHRTLLNRLRMAGIQGAVLVSRELSQDYTRHVELMLTGEDLIQIRARLSTLGIFSSRTAIPNLWHLVNPYTA